MSLRFGISVGSVLMVIVGWIPVIGPLLAGISAGIVTRGEMRKGVLVGFLSGLIGIIILFGVALFLTYWFKSPISSVVGTPLESIGKVSQSLIFIVLLILILEAPIFGLIGGLIGGILGSIYSSFQKISGELPEREDVSVIIQKLMIERDEVSKMLDNLKESLEAGKISQKTYKELKNKFEEKLDIIDKKLEKLRNKGG